MGNGDSMASSRTGDSGVSSKVGFLAERGVGRGGNWGVEVYAVRMVGGKCAPRGLDMLP